MIDRSRRFYKNIFILAVIVMMILILKFNIHPFVAIMRICLKKSGGIFDEIIIRVGFFQRKFNQ